MAEAVSRAKHIDTCTAQSTYPSPSLNRNNFSTPIGISSNSPSAIFNSLQNKLGRWQQAWLNLSLDGIGIPLFLAWILIPNVVYYRSMSGKHKIQIHSVSPARIAAPSPK
ncbi:hypothetical protein B9Z19DRAFT_1061219 [Tuber borchii]|uniref:Uncharacterized protein n=1 Tax=Tuber borchii TaxID=42251 RepID=A0A2T7A690_TUBBO|nr:hypothetical protein B9Z19DRAFT_1061219 [Tuber borchii]